MYILESKSFNFSLVGFEPFVISDAYSREDCSALALTNLCSAEDLRTIFIDNNGLELLLGLLGSTNLKQQLDGSIALYKLANKATTLSSIDAAPPSLTPQIGD
ncbi:hypothetical protein CsSME_00037555 [Camellia sinensis var. sinensis]